MLLERFETFMSRAKAILERKAHRKGYTTDEGDEGKELFDFVGGHFGGHPLGEIVYKCVRYRYGGDPMDLEKIAAWAYLVWQEAESRAPTTTEPLVMESIPGAPPGTPGSVPLTDFGKKLAAEQAQRLRNFTERDRHKRAELIAAVIRTVGKMAHDGSSERPKVWEAGPVRLAALVAEESGEAVKEALNMTRVSTLADYDRVHLKNLHRELLHTASMAITAAAVIKSREK